MKIYENLEQGTPEWLEARRGVLTSSVIGDLITLKKLQLSTPDTAKATVLKLATERITGRVESIPVSRDMQRGHDDEPVAREYYAQYAGKQVDQVGFITETYDLTHTNEKTGEVTQLEATLGYSPDGLVGDDGLIEIKSRKPEYQLRTIIDNHIPDIHMAQVQLGLLITGRKWCDYVSFWGGMRLFVTRVLPDKEWQEVLLEAGAHAELHIQNAIKQYETNTQGMPDTQRPFWYDDDEWED